MPHTFETQPIEVERFYSGVISQRNPLAIPIRIMGRRIIELYDAILSGNDAEITVRSTLQRRAGYSLFNSTVVGGIPQKWFSFEPNSSNGVIFPLLDTTTNIWYVPFGIAAPAPTNIFTKPSTTQSSFFAVGNFLYIGNKGFTKKWDGGAPQGLTNWGISVNAVGNSTTMSNALGTDGGGPHPWTITSTAVATISSPSGGSANTNLLNLTQYGFNIPATTQITGVQATINGNQTNHIIQNGENVIFVKCTLLANGASIGNFQAVVLPSSNGPVTIDLSSAAPLLTPSLVNLPSFGLQLTGVVNTGGQSCTFTIAVTTITILGNGGPSATPTGSGSFTATQGYQYLFVYGNSFDANISNPTPASSSTGAFSNKANVQLQLTASNDPQVNQIRAFRTTDTGTGAVFFELPTSPYPNTSQTVADSAADITLSVSSAIQVGSIAFTPPPAGLRLMAWYAGRLWGAVGNLLYFSAGPDNAPLGNGNSNWPPNNVFELSSTIVKLSPLAGGNGMLVTCLNKIHIVQGIQNPGFTVNIWLNDIGARQENAIDSDGSTIYMFTSDRQFLQITSQGINELSQYVSDTTDTFDPTQVYVVQHRFGSQDSRVFLSDGSTRIYPYNLMSQCWEPIQTPVDGGGVGAINSIEITPGIWRFVKAGTTANKAMLYRDQTVFTDNLQQYTWGATFGNIPVADPTQLANVDSLVLRMTNAGNLPTVGILPNDISGAFIPLTTQPQFEPPEATAPSPGHRANRYYWSTGTNLWSQVMHFQLQFTFGVGNAQEEILSWGIFPNESADQPVGALPAVQGR